MEKNFIYRLFAFLMMVTLFTNKINSQDSGDTKFKEINLIEFTDTRGMIIPVSYESP